MRGYDKEWIAAGTRRVAYYTHLPPGAYTFEVQAADDDGEAWEAAGASADVRVLTPFYRTWWMKTLLGLLLLGGLSFFVWTRRRTDMERSRIRQTFTHKLIETQEGERKRIAHELHDSLGQHLALIRTLALLPTARTGAAGDHLVKIADQSAVAIQEVESISYDPRPYQLDRLGLTRAIRSLIEDCETSSLARVVHSVENIDGLFGKPLEINVYRIVQEALANILKHAEATEVSVRAEARRIGDRPRVEASSLSGRHRHIYPAYRSGPALRGDRPRHSRVHHQEFRSDGRGRRGAPCRRRRQLRQRDSASGASLGYFNSTRGCSDNSCLSFEGLTVSGNSIGSISFFDSPNNLNSSSNNLLFGNIVYANAGTALQAAASTPEPSSIALLGTGLAAFSRRAVARVRRS